MTPPRCGCRATEDDEFPCARHEAEIEKRIERMNRRDGQINDAANAAIDSLPGELDGVTIANTRAGIVAALLAWWPEEVADEQDS